MYIFKKTSGYIGLKMNKTGIIQHKNILLLQGPMGSFFKKVDFAFRKRGAKTFRIGLNAGDQFFAAQDNYTAYRGSKEKWEFFLHNFLTRKKIDKVFLFGDCRYYQQVAIGISERMGLDIFVFEEGYIRPDFITMERFGVNDYSHIPRDRHFYEQLDISKLETREVKPADSRYYRMGWSAAIYYLLCVLLKYKYPYYQHHRELNLHNELFFGLRNLIRKYQYKVIERSLPKQLFWGKKKYYFVPLQTQNDFQVRIHSDFSTIEAFIETVIRSFADFSPKNTYLLIKHHPMDRGKNDYKQHIIKVAKMLGVSERVLIVYDLHLPTCLKNAIGTVTINSTVGLSSLHHGTPVITLGRAIYDIEGLTSKKMTLDNFWMNYQVPQRDIFEKFRQYLIEQTQLNGSFYGRFPEELEDNTV